MFTRSPKFIRISFNDLCDEVFKEFSFTGDPLQFLLQAAIYFCMEVARGLFAIRVFVFVKSCVRGKGRAIFHSSKLLRFPVLFVGVTNMFPFLHTLFNLLSSIPFYILHIP